MPDSKSSPELWQVACDWLRACGIKLDPGFCEQEITSHPDYPSLASLVDFLDKGAMAYQGVRVEDGSTAQLPYPLLAHISTLGRESIHLIANKESWDREPGLRSNWTGIILYAGEDSHWRHADHNYYRRDTIKKQIFATAIFIAGICSLAVASFRICRQSTVSQQGPVILLGVLAFAGIAISILLSAIDILKTSRLTRAFCGPNDASGCRIVAEAGSNWFGKVSPAAAALIYFLSQFSLFFAGSFFNKLQQGLLLPACCAITVIPWSIHSQLKLRRWCVLCLGLSAIILFQLPLILFWIHPAPNWYTGIDAFTMTFLSIALFVAHARSVLKKNEFYKQEMIKFKKWRYDPSLFVFQWEKEKRVDVTAWQNDLLFGEASAPLLLTIAFSRQCCACSEAFNRVCSMQERFSGQLRVQVRLILKDQDPNGSHSERALLRKAAKCSDSHKLLPALRDWVNTMDIGGWIRKWQPDEDQDVGERLTQHRNWASDNQISHTPTLILNGKKISTRYSLVDLEALLPQLSQSLPIVN